jgi:hypothetical protein
VWAEAHADLTEALAAEERSRSRLLGLDADGARRLPDTRAVVRRISSTVGEAAVGDAARSAGVLLTDLGAATGTSDLRGVAERALAQRTAVAAAQEGLGGGTDGEVLAAFSAALQSVGELRGLTPAETAVWPPVRTRLDDALRVVADADDSLEAGAVARSCPWCWPPSTAWWPGPRRRRPPGSRSTTPPWPPRARTARRCAGTPSRSAPRRPAGAACRPPSSGCGRGRCRTGLRGWRGRGHRRRAARRPGRHRSAARGGAAHADLVAAVERVRVPLGPAGSEPDCPDCPAVDDEVPTGDGVEQAVAALPAWQPALTAWESAVAAAEAEINGRVLPPPPDV